MPHVLWQLQGERIKVPVPRLKDGEPVKDHEGHDIVDFKFETVTPGTMTKADYDRTVTDLVNFLVWIGEPHQVQRKQLGVWVFFAVILLIFLTYALKKSYWKDVH